MNWRTRLARLERDCVRTLAPTYVCLDDRGLVSGFGSDALRPWLGRSFDELSAALPRGTPLKVYLFDPQFDPGA